MYKHKIYNIYETLQSTLLHPTGIGEADRNNTSCEKGVNYFIDGQTCICWGDPHCTMFNGEYHDFQGLMSSGKKRFYYVTPCAGYDYNDIIYIKVINKLILFILAHPF